MNEIQIFKYNQSEVRTVDKDGEPWFVLKDVCEVLGLTTPARVAERLDEDEVSQTHIIDSLGRQQETTIINESGLYNVILRSDKPEAKPFRKWVTSEVLPSIRKTGGYIVEQNEKYPTNTMSNASEKRAEAMLLNAKNRAAKDMQKLWNIAGVEPRMQAIALNDYYPGLELPRIALSSPDLALLDKTAIAEHLGMWCEGYTNPHAKAVGVIIKSLTLEPGECQQAPYSKNGHMGTSPMYTQAVEDKVRDWLDRNSWPAIIVNDQGTKYYIRYRTVKKTT